MTQTFPQFLQQIWFGFADRFDAISQRGKYAPPKSGANPVPRPEVDPRSVPDGLGGRFVPASRLTDAEQAARGRALMDEVERNRSPLPKSWSPDQVAAVAEIHRREIARTKPHLQRAQLGPLRNPTVSSEIPGGKRIESGALSSNGRGI